MAIQPFNSYLDGGKPEGTTANFTGYRHATKLYLTDNFKKVPKFGHMYFVKFNLHPDVANQLTTDWDKKFTALLIKDVQLPKFKIATETINQYNRKTNVQTKLTYEPLNFSFHDDMGGTTNGFWTNYYKYYYADSRFGDASASPGVKTAYADTKYSNPDNDNTYGFNPIGSSILASSTPYFLESIDIYQLHAGPSHRDYTRFRLINPLISAWEHDSMAQGGESKILQNKMTVVYEDVIYSSGKMQRKMQSAAGDDSVLLFEDPEVYDTTPTTLTAGPGGQPPDFNFARLGLGGVNKDLYDYTTLIPQYPPHIPSPAEYQKAGLSIGSIINAINLVKAFKSNPRQAWNIYGINLKNMLTGAVVGAISSNPANVVGRGGNVNNPQGQFSFSPPDVGQSTYLNTSLGNPGTGQVNNRPPLGSSSNSGEQNPS